MKTTFKLALVLVSSLISLSAFAGGNIANGKALADKTCAACHGVDFKSPIDPAYPVLAGQNADYLEHALIAYQRGNTVSNGRANAIMAGMAKPLTHTEIKDVAAYLHSLPGPLVIRR